ncbi:S8 family peptidase [Aliifodinibius salicampi]|uniref:S8 family peptidase n=1 Tax=Fodinibius salicampi TaxID=1920655 RepID=A0ABT3PU02_9BACT|nr:S8 family peptidase [Fodinibius salicampi]MCW9711310.1 S8 family peptidase [Fodinibius salicampi]
MIKRLFIIVTLFATIYGCSSSQMATKNDSSQDKTTPQEKVDQPVDFSTMLKPPEGWHHWDEEQTQFRGISSELAYTKILSDNSPEEKVVVAVIDGGVDTNHEDLDDVMWINEDEIPDNGKDDDGNGYVDDVHGWNFIGGSDGKNVNHDTFELTRIYRSLHQEFKNADTTSFSKKKQEQYSYYKQIKSDYEEEVNRLHQQYNNIESLNQSMQEAKNILDEHYADSSYSYEDIQELDPTSQELNFAKNVMSYILENEIDSTLIADQKKQIYEFAKYGYNPDFNPRDIVGDNYEDKSERIYGNNDVAGPDPSHGTHVAGIIAAERDNGIGVNGVATNTYIMAIRAVPNGDERDKDVANAIRYAVDNGADIINMSFGKSYSPHKEVVDKAVAHANKNNVLMVHGAGNSAQNTDTTANYPTDKYGSAVSDSAATLWMSVGATSWKPNEEFIANFSNYGDETVDLFAPGVDIYSTMPDNKYEFQSGTSMASPVVAGTAALIMAYYPELTAKQVRQIILENSIQYPNQLVTVPSEGNPEESEQTIFPELSVSDGLVNVYKALRAAEEMSQ